MMNFSSNPNTDPRGYLGSPNGGGAAGGFQVRDGSSVMNAPNMNDAAARGFGVSLMPGNITAPTGSPLPGGGVGNSAAAAVWTRYQDSTSFPQADGSQSMDLQRPHYLGNSNNPITSPNAVSAGYGNSGDLAGALQLCSSAATSHFSPLLHQQQQQQQCQPISYSVAPPPPPLVTPPAATAAAHANHSSGDDEYIMIKPQLLQLLMQQSGQIYQELNRGVDASGIISGNMTTSGGNGSSSGVAGGPGFPGFLFANEGGGGRNSGNGDNRRRGRASPAAGPPFFTSGNAASLASPMPPQQQSPTPSSSMYYSPTLSSQPRQAPHSTVGHPAGMNYASATLPPHLQQHVVHGFNDASNSGDAAVPSHQSRRENRGNSNRNNGANSGAFTALPPHAMGLTPPVLPPPSGGHLVSGIFSQHQHHHQQQQQQQQQQQPRRGGSGNSGSNSNSNTQLFGSPTHQVAAVPRGGGGGRSSAGAPPATGAGSPGKKASRAAAAAGNASTAGKAGEAGGSSADNGSHYTVNQWYEGYVKRYNPLRGFGFLTGKFALSFDLRQCEDDLRHMAEKAVQAQDARTTDVAAVLRGGRGSEEDPDVSCRTPPEKSTSCATQGPPTVSPLGKDGEDAASTVTHNTNSSPAHHGTVVPSTMQWYLHKLASKESRRALSPPNSPANNDDDDDSYPKNRLVRVDEESTLGDIFVHHSCISLDGFRVLPVNTRVRFSVSVLMNTVQAVDVVPLDEEFWVKVKPPPAATDAAAVAAESSLPQQGSKEGVAEDTLWEPASGLAEALEAAIMPAFSISKTAELVLKHHADERERLHKLQVASAEGQQSVQPRSEKSFWDDMAAVPSPAVPNSLEGQSELQAVQVVDHKPQCPRGDDAGDEEATAGEGVTKSADGNGSSNEEESAGGTGNQGSSNNSKEDASPTSALQQTTVQQRLRQLAGQFKDYASGTGNTNDNTNSTAGGMTSSKNNETGTGSGSENKTDTKTSATTPTTGENHSSENILGTMESSESRNVKGTTETATNTVDNMTGTGDNTTGNEANSSSDPEKVVLVSRHLRRSLSRSKREKNHASVDPLTDGYCKGEASGSDATGGHANAGTAAGNVDKGNEDADVNERKLLAALCSAAVAPAKPRSPNHHPMKENATTAPAAAVGAGAATGAGAGQRNTMSSEEEEYEAKGHRKTLTPLRPRQTPSDDDAVSFSSPSGRTPTSTSAVVAPTMDWTTIFDKKMEDERQKDILLHKGDYLKNFFPSQQLQQQQQQERENAKKAAAAAVVAATTNPLNTTPRPNANVEIMPMSAVGELDSSSSRGVESQKNALDESSSVQDVDAAADAHERQQMQLQHGKKKKRSCEARTDRGAAPPPPITQSVPAVGQDYSPPNEHAVDIDSESDPLDDRIKKSSPGSGSSENTPSSGQNAATGSGDSKLHSKQSGSGDIPNSSSGPIPQTTATGRDSQENETTPTLMTSAPTEEEGSSGNSNSESDEKKTQKRSHMKEKEMGRNSPPPLAAADVAAAEASATKKHSASANQHNQRSKPPAVPAPGGLASGYYRDSDTPQSPIPNVSSHINTSSASEHNVATSGHARNANDQVSSSTPSSAGSSMLNNLMMVPVSLLPAALASQVPAGVGVIALPRSIVANLGVDVSKINPFLSAAQPMGVYCNEAHRTRSRRSRPGSSRPSGPVSSAGEGINVSDAALAPPPPHYQSPTPGSLPSQALPPPPPHHMSIGASNAYRQFVGVHSGSSMNAPLDAGYRSTSSSSASPGSGAFRHHSHEIQQQHRQQQQQQQHITSTFPNYWSEDSSENNGAYKAVFLFNPDQDAALRPHSSLPDTQGSGESSDGGGGDMDPRADRKIRNQLMRQSSSCAGSACDGVGCRDVGNGSGLQSFPSYSAGGSQVHSAHPIFSTAAHTGKTGRAAARVAAAASPSFSSPVAHGHTSSVSSSSLGCYKSFNFPVPPRVPMESIEVPQPPWLRRPSPPAAKDKEEGRTDDVR